MSHFIRSTSRIKDDVSLNRAIWENDTALFELRAKSCQVYRIIGNNANDLNIHHISENSNGLYTHAFMFSRKSYIFWCLISWNSWNYSTTEGLYHPFQVVCVCLNLEMVPSPNNFTETIDRFRDINITNLCVCEKFCTPTVFEKVQACTLSQKCV